MNKPTEDYKAILETEMYQFEAALNAHCEDGWTVEASNAFTKDGKIYYYALLYKMVS